MELSEFNYELPEELIAQTPIEKRDESRLMILDKNTGKIEHKIFIRKRVWFSSNKIMVNELLEKSQERVLPENEQM